MMNPVEMHKCVFCGKTHHVSNCIPTFWAEEIEYFGPVCLTCADMHLTQNPKYLEEYDLKENRIVPQKARKMNEQALNRRVEDTNRVNGKIKHVKQRRENLNTRARCAALRQSLLSMSQDRKRKIDLTAENDGPSPKRQRTALPPQALVQLRLSMRSFFNSNGNDFSSLVGLEPEASEQSLAEFGLV